MADASVSKTITIPEPIALVGIQVLIVDFLPKMHVIWKYFDSVAERIPNKIIAYRQGFAYAISQRVCIDGVDGYSYFVGIPVRHLEKVPDFAVAKIIDAGDFYSSHIDDQLLTETRVDETVKVKSEASMTIEVYPPDSSKVYLWTRKNRPQVL